MNADCSDVFLDIRRVPRPHLLGCKARFQCFTGPKWIQYFCTFHPYNQKILKPIKIQGKFIRMIADCSGVLLDIRHAPESYLLGCGVRFYCSTSPNVFKFSVRMIRTGRNSKIKQNHAKWTGTLRKPTIWNTVRHIASVMTITIHYPALMLPIVNQTRFFSVFFRFLSTYGRNRLVEGPKIHRSDSKTRGIDVFYFTWAADQILFKNIEKQKS